MSKYDNLLAAAEFFVDLGDSPGIFMTCESGTDEKPCVRLRCQNLQHAHDVHGAIIDLVSSVREIRKGTL